MFDRFFAVAVINIVLTAFFSFPSQADTSNYQEVSESLVQQSKAWRRAIADLPVETHSAEGIPQLFRSFKRYDDAVLVPLKNLGQEFKQPGMAVVYKSCLFNAFAQFIDGDGASAMNREITNLMQDPSAKTSDKKFLQNLLVKLDLITPLQIYNMCACQTNDVWNSMLTPPYHAVYNKMARGENLNEADRDVFRTTARSFQKVDTGYHPFNCMAKSLGVYEGFVKIINR